MNTQKLKIATFCAGIAAMTVCAQVCIPQMRQITIGTVHADAEPAESTAPQTEPPVTVRIPPALSEYIEPSENNVSARESDGSKAMHSSLPYLNTHATDGGAIKRTQYKNLPGAMFFRLDGGGQVRNSTSWTNADLKAESKILPKLDLKTDGTPMVLIYHTHTTESYMDSEASAYPAAFNFRTSEPDKNMVAVGDAITAELAAAGIGVIHTAEIHDYPKWNGSYSRSAVTVKEILAENPSICIALDIHRDAICTGNDVIAPVCTVDGRQSAQIMICSGCDKGDMNMPNYRENFHLACCIQQTAEQMFPGLTRPILFDYRRYNQDITTGSLLIEVGSQGNSMEEARYAGTLTGKVIAAVVQKLAANK